MADLKKKKPADKKAGESGAGAVAPVKRTTVVQFFQEVRREAQKVTWPTFRETWVTTVLVFVMVSVTMVFFFAVDWLLAYGERLLVGATG